MSHVADALIGTMKHHNPYTQPPPMYSTPQYPSIYRGPSYYPPPPYQQCYPVAPPPSMSGHSPAPIMCMDSQPSSGSPSTSAYNLGTSEITSPYYAPIDHYQKTICIFHFLLLHNRFLLHMDTHIMVLILFSPLPFRNFILLNS
jgi:hypothetical protein